MKPARAARYASHTALSFSGFCELKFKRTSILSEAAATAASAVLEVACARPSHNIETLPTVSTLNILLSLQLDDPFITTERLSARSRLTPGFRRASPIRPTG